MNSKSNNIDSSLNIKNNKSDSKKYTSKVKNNISNVGNKKSTPLHSKSSKKQKISALNSKNTQDTVVYKKTENSLEHVKSKEFRINKTALLFNEYVYVDNLNGSDESLNGDLYMPFATIKKAMDYLNENTCTKEKCAIILKRGSYDISTILDKEYRSFNSKYKGMNISFIAMPAHRGSVFLTSSFGFEPTVKDDKISLIFNGIIFKNIKGLGMTLNNDENLNEYYNCVFDNIAVGGYSSSNSNYSVSVINCLFINTTERDSKNRIYGKCINSASTNDNIQPMNGEISRNLYNCSIDDNYNITSTEWKNSGVGKNPDESDANIGVYGGEFSWLSAEQTNLLEFKINNTPLFFKKFVYVDNSYGNNEWAVGDYNNPFKSVQHAMDYLNDNETFRTNCAIIFKEGSYDISDILIENDLNNKYDNMNVSWIADIGYQGKVFINSEKGFNPSTNTNGVKFNFYGLVFKNIYGEGFTLNCDKYVNEYYNCVFDNVAISALSKNEDSLYSVIRNCLFVNSSTKDSEFKAYGKCINCASTNKYVQPLNEKPVKALYECNIDNFYNVVSYGSEHCGIGTNPDNSKANIGVYGGEFAWRIPNYSNSEFKINNTALTFNKFVYIDSLNGKDEEAIGDYSSPFKTVRYAMDYLNTNRIFRNKCAIIFKEGTYDISDCLKTENGSLRKEYNGMNVSWIADIGYQGKVFINSPYGFKTTVADQENNDCSIEMKFYGLVFKDIKNNGMTLNGDKGLNEYYNCVFENISVSGSNEHDKETYARVYNSLFVNTTKQNSDFNIKGQCINCVTNNDHIEPENGEMLNVLFNCYIDCNYYSINSRGWINTGMGTNPDNSQANLGVYGGDFAWR